MEQEYKKFQKDLFKNDEYLSGPNQMKDEEKNEKEKEEEEEDFLIDDDVLKQIIDEGFKDGQDSIPAYTTSLDNDWWDRPLTMSNDQWR